MLPEDVTVTNPHKGIWHVAISGSGTKIGVVHGDAVMGYAASNGNGVLMGSDFSSAEDAVEALTASLATETDLR
ncbi:MAG: hypothetical protein HHJ11_14210 [Phycicoccus sp.]|nr:hypothetical protein [Phycicoccus sp.]NMM34186.1 hypothetical protein [Phycicoccus sp.]